MSDVLWKAIKIKSDQISFHNWNRHLFLIIVPVNQDDGFDIRQPRNVVPRSEDLGWPNRIGQLFSKSIIRPLFSDQKLRFCQTLVSNCIAKKLFEVSCRKNFRKGVKLKWRFQFRCQYIVGILTPTIKQPRESEPTPNLRSTYWEV